MATTGTVKGNLVGVFVQDGDADGDTDFDLIACATNASFSLSNELIDTVCKDNDGARSFIAGMQSLTVSVEGLTAYDNVGRDILFTRARDKTTVVIKYGTGVTGDPFAQANAIITAFEETAGVNDVTTFNITFECSGMTTGTF